MTEVEHNSKENGSTTSEVLDPQKVEVNPQLASPSDITVTQETDSPVLETALGAEMFLPASAHELDVLAHDQSGEYEDASVELPPVLGRPLDDEAPLGEDLPLPDGRFADRELSWLAFNERVLEQSETEDLPLLERLWFSAIFSSNLDEFFMVRVAGLKRRIAAGIAKPAASGLSPGETLRLITARTRELMARQSQGFLQDMKPKLDAEGIHLTTWDDLDGTQKERLSAYFRDRVFPMLTPLSVDPSHPFPYISGLSINLAVVVENPATGKQHFARLKVPENLPRLVSVEAPRPGAVIEPYLAKNSGASFITVEDLIKAHLFELFPGVQIKEAHTFRLTRNEDLEVEEDDAENLLTAMEEELLRRRFGPTVRLEVATGITPFVLKFLMERLQITNEDVYQLPAPLDYTCFNQLHELDLPHLKFPPFVPVTAAGLSEVESATPGDVFGSLRTHDVLVHHPYDSFATSVQQFISQAARDPNVVAIKQTLYRTSGDSPIVTSLIEAAISGKQVVAIVEIKARFDEEANISWARKLETAGVHVVYGVLGLKTHCKLSLVVREEVGGLRHYAHIGTGNYHPRTARGYEDLGLLTANKETTRDVALLFNQLSGYAPHTSFKHLLVAPSSIRTGLIERIQNQVARKRAGLNAWIGIKVNSIVDEETIDALYRASQAGVKVDIVVRGICALRAGVKGLSENIKVRSILGRYLEHSRIYAFGIPGDGVEAWIGSADLMHRNLDRRVEALVRINDSEQVDFLVSLIKSGVSPRVSSWHLRKGGSWKRHTLDKDGNDLVDLQDVLMRDASDRVVGR